MKLIILIIISNLKIFLIQKNLNGIFTNKNNKIVNKIIMNHSVIIKGFNIINNIKKQCDKNILSKFNGV